MSLVSEAVKYSTVWSVSSCNRVKTYAGRRGRRAGAMGRGGSVEVKERRGEPYIV